MTVDPSPTDALLSPRDRFAFQALNGLLARHGSGLKPSIVARMSYEIADAMMSGRVEGTDPLRERSAEQALNGLLAAQGTALKAEVVARMAYELADALISMRGSSSETSSVQPNSNSSN